MKEPSHDLEAESAALASLMGRPKGIWTAIQMVTPEDFYLERNRLIYGAMVDIAENGDGKIDVVSVKNALRFRGELDLAGGVSYMSTLFDAVPDISNLESYLNIIIRHSKKRKLVKIGEGLIADGDQDQQLGDALDALIRVADASDRKMSMPLEDIGQKYEDDQESGLTAQAFTTGIPGLDNIVTFRRENMVVIAGHPATGKSSLGLQIALNVMKQGRVLFVSMEMGMPELWERAVQFRTGVSASVIDNPRYAPEPIRAKIAAASAELRSGPRTLEIFAPNHCTPQTILGKAMSLKARYGDLTAVIVDYLQRVHWHERGLGPVQETTEKSRAMKDMARVVGVPVVVLSQLSRNSAREGKEPQLHDLRDSGAIEQDADVAIFTHRPDQETNDALLLVRKQRHGPTGRVKCLFDGTRCRFDETTRTYEP